MQLNLWTTGLTQFLTTSQCLNSLLAIGVVIVHATFYGVLICKILKLEFADIAAKFSVLIGIGLTVFGLQVALMGSINLWHRPAFLISSLAATIFFAMLWRKRLPELKLSQWAGAIRVYLANQGKFRLAMWLATLLVMASAVVAAIKPPYAQDEIGYHWAAPLAWIKAGHWIHLPFRYMNGACLTELLYLTGAAFDSATAAHWTHALFFLVLASGCATLARLFGPFGIVAMAGCCSTPVIVNQIGFAFNDIAAPALGIAGLVALLRVKRESDAAFKSATIATAILLVGLYSIKPALAPAVALSYLVVLYRSGINRVHPGAVKHAAIVFSFALLGAVAAWTLHTKNLTGQYFDSNCVVVVGADQSLRDHQEAIAKLPSLKSVAILPLLPFFTPILGQQEPYGGRTGFVGIGFALLLIGAWKKMSEEQRLNCSLLVAALLVNFVLVGVLTVRTRYLNYSWAILVCLGAVGVGFARANYSNKWRSVLSLVFCVCIFLGVFDTLHVLLHWQDKEMTPIIPQFKFPE